MYDARDRRRLLTCAFSSQHFWHLQHKKERRIHASLTWQLLCLSTLCCSEKNTTFVFLAVQKCPQNNNRNEKSWVFVKNTDCCGVASFLTIMFHEVVYQRLWSLVGSLMTTFYTFTAKSASEKFWQELSYHKQTAHQLCTQYVENINSKPVTLKSTLRVTEGHWKRNHLDR